MTENKISRFIISKSRIVLKKLGVEIVPIRYSHSLNTLFWMLEASEIPLETIFDIGAHQGNWTNKINGITKGKKHFVLFEPNKTHNKFLQRTGFPFHNVLLSDVEKEIDFFSISSTGDSYYPEKGNPLIENAVPTKTKCRTLDQMLVSNQLPQPDFIKIDTQGAEIDILKGANKVVKQCSVILLECPIMEYNSGAPNLQQYLDYMESIDYVPFELPEIHIVSKKLVQIDIAFIRRDLIQQINRK